jgi:hypothetical protein
MFCRVSSGEEEKRGGGRERERERKKQEDGKGEWGGLNNVSHIHTPPFSSSLPSLVRSVRSPVIGDTPDFSPFHKIPRCDGQPHWVRRI